MHAQLSAALDGSPAERRRWKRRAFELSAVEDLEFFLMRRFGASKVPRLVEVRGVEHLAAALRGGRGAVLYSGHIHSHHAAFAALRMLGYPLNVVGSPPVFGPSQAEVDFQRRRHELLEREFGCRFLYMQSGDFAVAVRAAHALRRNEVVALLIDKTVSPHTVEAAFLGGRQPFPVGPALLAQSTGAAMIDFYAHRDRRWFPLVVELGRAHLAADDVQAAMAECASRLERHIRRHPAEWYMLLDVPS